ncbi:MAG: sigma 54-interacting transcriptional regulator [Labilithrix sp.]|nr:sigma 54-interacting transcriptional regulator [Labilithrix sp.]MCW5811932.1 sigma 54-interacting transcriptional regulator [Labilithrix sp.]
MSSRDSEGTDRGALTELTSENKAATGTAAPRLTAFWDGGSLARVLPVTGTLTIGRSSGCDVRIDHTSVSRKHAVLHVGAVTKIEDAGSANGTKVAGRMVGSGQQVTVQPGEIIEIGNVVVVLQGGDKDAAAASAPAFRPTPSRPSKLPPAAHSTTIAPPGARANETPMQRLERLVKLVAAGNIHVLITGETGVGKEVVAERIHRASRRAAGPFHRVEAAALAENLLDIELFGQADKPGLFETSNGGTVLVDEVSELPLGTQAKLLRVLERSEVIRVDTAEPRKVDVRFIAATNRDLRAMVSEGTFREDLYFRLNGITIEVPPLRERREQIATIANELLAKACADAKRAGLALTKEATQRLESYDWPGNVRELKNALERAVLLSQGDELDVNALPAGDAGDEAAGARLRNDLAAFERQRIVEALEKCAGNQTKAAQLLGISRRTLVSRLGEYNLPRPRGGGGQR